MNPRLLALLASLLLASTACEQRVVLYCDEDTPCESPERPFCDVEGEYPASEGAGNTCIPDPFAGADAGPMTDGGGNTPDGGDTAREPTWKDVTPNGGSPSERKAHAMAYDAARERVVLFGGFPAGSARLDDTWISDGTSWVDVSPATSPDGRIHHAMAYDAARERVVLFGGKVEGEDVIDDTWEWDGSSWNDVTPSSASPSPRYGHKMVYDPARERIVLFGGLNGTDLYEDTYSGTEARGPT